jgi:Protein of unknown function (DUF3631)
MTANENARLDAEIVANDDQRRGQMVLRQVHDFLGRFVSYPSKEAHDAHALWIAHTHLMDHWDSTPRIAFLSPEPMSGKSRALEVTALLVPNPVASINVTPAYLFRKISSEDGLPTVLYDEIDTVFGPKAKDNEEIRGVLNAGHHRGATAGRCVVHGKTVTTEELPAYCAVALAGLGWLPDTILTRSIIVRMRRRAPGETVEPFRRRIHPPQAAPLYSALETWARGVLTIVWPDLPPEIQDRDADVWESLIAIADIVGGSWPERSRKAAVALVAASRDAEPSLGIRLLADAKTVFADADTVPTKTLLRDLIDLPESPWGDMRGKPLDERGLAKRLRQYGIKSANIKLDGGSVAKGYRHGDFHDAWSRYLPPPPDNSATSATSATVVIFQREKVADEVAGSVSVSATENTNGHNPVAAVAAVAHLPGNGSAPRVLVCAQCEAEDQEHLLEPHLFKIDQLATERGPEFHTSPAEGMR